MPFVGKVLEGAAQPVGSDADGVIQLTDPRDTEMTMVLAPTRKTTGRRSKRTTQ